MDAITGVRGWILKQTGWNNVMFRAAVALTLTYWIGALVAAPALYFSEPQSGWLAFDLLDVVELVFGVYALPLSALLWIGFAALRFAGGERTRVLVVLGLAAPFLYHVALLAPGVASRTWHDFQRKGVRVVAIDDKPLVGGTGAPIGVRLIYRVNFPWGLSALEQQPPAGAPTADLYLALAQHSPIDFVTRDSSLWRVGREGFARGEATIVADFVPPFLPLALQRPEAFPASDPANLCYRWRNTDERASLLAVRPQPLAVEIGPFGRYVARGSRRTSHVYNLVAFYEGARAMGARECPSP
jgi:hypothetical protein